MRRFAVDVSVLRPVLSGTPGTIRVTGLQDPTFGTLFPGTPERVLATSPATGKQGSPLGQGDEFVHQGGVSHLLSGLEGSGPNQGR